MKTFISLAFQMINEDSRYQNRLLAVESKKKKRKRSFLKKCAKKKTKAMTDLIEDLTELENSNNQLKYIGKNLTQVAYIDQDWRGF